MYLGIDTSCYTTSVAVIDNKNNIIVNEKRILNVKKGTRGLRQSEAVYQHVNNIPILIEIINKKIDSNMIKCVSVSSKPRPIKNSFMPVFICGESYAKTISSLLCVPLKRFSHQEGHIFSALMNSDKYSILEKDFIVYHISGGTTELLKVSKTHKGLRAEIIGGTLDISAGMLIDRIGVAMGFDFPCGPTVEKYAALCKDKIELPVCVKDTWINFSGPETKTLKMVNEGINNENICMSLLNCIEENIIRTLSKAIEMTNIENILMVGGVCSNSIIKANILNKFKDVNIYFADPGYSCDNAVGIAALGMYF